MVRGGYRCLGDLVDTPGMAVDVRTLTEAELPEAWAVLSRAFGHASHPDDVDVELALVDPARAYGAHVDDRLVATAASFDFRMAVPGRVVPVAGVTWVSVLPTYRRRGLLGALMERQLTDLHESGTSVAALWASEGAIYGRYGYGAAAWNLTVTLPRGAAFGLPVPPGDLDLVDPSAERARPPPTSGSRPRRRASRRATTGGGPTACTTRRTPATAAPSCSASSPTAATRSTPCRAPGPTRVPPGSCTCASSWPRTSRRGCACGGTCSTST